MTMAEHGEMVPPFLALETRGHNYSAYLRCSKWEALRSTRDVKRDQNTLHVLPRDLIMDPSNAVPNNEGVRHGKM